MSGVSQIIQGILHFQERIFGGKKSLFHRLGNTQSPLALFITCSDSRIDPNMLTQTQPGELFILRNAGNLVPPSSIPSGEGATIEFALKQLHIHDVIVCGHSNCGAMRGLLAPESLQQLPAVANWLKYAKDILPTVERLGAGLSPDDKLELAIERNTLLQLEHVMTYPFAMEALAAGRLRLHAWVYHIATGQVTAHHPSKERFVPLDRSSRYKWSEGIPAESVEQDGLGESI